MLKLNSAPMGALFTHQLTQQVHIEIHFRKFYFILSSPLTINLVTDHYLEKIRSMVSFCNFFNDNAEWKYVSRGSIQEASVSKSLSDRLKVVSLPVLVGGVELVGWDESLFQAQYGVVVFLLELHVDVWEMPIWPLFISPSLGDFLAWNYFCKLSTYVASEQRVSKRRIKL